MRDSDPEFDITVRAAEQVVEVLRGLGLDGLVIGAAALAVHGYPRNTVDFDLAVATEPHRLEQIAQILRGRGFEVTVRLPDPEDPLGGVLDARLPGADLIQVVNFSNPPSSGFPRLVTDSVSEATPLVHGGHLKVVDPYHLIAFKLYAGGAKSKIDILELLDRNPDLDRGRIEELCREYHLDAEWNALVRLERES